jgi:hypothetical protein
MVVCLLAYLLICCECIRGVSIHLRPSQRSKPISLFVTSINLIKQLLPLLDFSKSSQKTWNSQPYLAPVQAYFLRIEEVGHHHTKCLCCWNWNSAAQSCMHSVAVRIVSTPVSEAWPDEHPNNRQSLYSQPNRETCVHLVVSNQRHQVVGI